MIVKRRMFDKAKMTVRVPLLQGSVSWLWAMQRSVRTGTP